MRADLVLDAACELAEGPVWEADGARLWWTDIAGKAIHWLAPETGRGGVHALPGRVGSFALRRGGGLVLAMERGFAAFDPETGVVAGLCEPEADLSEHRFNDGRCDPAGRFLAGSMNETRRAATGRLWRLDADGAATSVADGVTIANGLAFSPDGRTMYWADSPSGAVHAFDYDVATGRASNRRAWLEAGAAPGSPDGAAVDADGCYWSARWGGGAVVRVTPDGRVDRTVALPVSRVTMCAFGGPDLRTLYITTAWEGMGDAERGREPLAGGLFAASPGVQGLPEPFFEGLDGGIAR